MLYAGLLWMWTLKVHIFYSGFGEELCIKVPHQVVMLDICPKIFPDKIVFLRLIIGELKLWKGDKWEVTVGGEDGEMWP